MSDNDNSALGARIITRCGVATHVGNVRDTNEDSVLASAPIFVVADGMGGHEAGEVASSIAIEEFATLAGRRMVTPQELGTALGRAAKRIAVLGEGEERKAGTTVALVSLTEVDGSAYWLVMNLGDSRVYRLAAGELEQVSVDHSVVQELVELGEITADAARHHPYRNMVTRALGAGGEPDPDFWVIPAEQDDRLLVCSDGLTTEVEDPMIREILTRETEPQAAADSLVQHALLAGGHDNVSVIVVDAADVTSAAGQAAEATTPSASAASGSGHDDANEDTSPRQGDRR